MTQRVDGHPLQLSGWGGLKERFGWQPWRLALAERGDLLCGSQVLVRGLLGVKLAYIPRGPLVDWTNRAQVDALIDALRAECRRQHIAVLKIEPELPDTPSNREVLARTGFTPSDRTVQPPSTIMVDLTAGEDAILGAMKSKWRYNVRLAARKEVTVRTMAPSDLPAFHKLMAETGRRDGFSVHSDAYFDAAFDLLAPEHAAFLLAEYAGEPLASIVVAMAGQTAVYLWGASSERERSRMPNHALQWAGMQWALRHGAARYDLWGIPDELGQLAMALAGESAAGAPADSLPIDLEALRGDGLWGVHRFKQGFGGRALRTVGAWDMPIDPLGARLYTVGLKAQEMKAGVAASIRGRQNGDAGAHGRTDGRGAGQVELIDTPERWRAVLEQTPSPHVLQSWEWGQVKGQTEWRAERVALNLPAGQAAFQFLWRAPVPKAPARIAYIPKGPLLDWTNLDLVDQTLAAVEAHARNRGCIFVKIDPDVREDTTTGRLALHALQRRGWRFSAEQIQFKNTATTDLRAGVDALLEGMKSKTRYNVRLAQKRGITVREGADADLTSFYALYAETGQRDGFLIRPLDYYLTTWATFLRAQNEPGNPAGGALLLAGHPDDAKPVAGLLLLRYAATTWYFYGASSERHRRDMPNHLLQWSAMQWAIAQGCTTYDWWGAPTVLDDETDRMQGVWQFKEGFGAEFRPHIGAWDFAVSPVGYRLVTESMPFVLSAMRRLRTSAP